MKRLSLIFFISLITVLVSSCGQAKVNTIPDKHLEWEVEDYVQQHEERGGKYTDFSYVVNHDPDKTTRTDTVDIDLTITYPYVSTLVSFHGVYQLDSVSEKWTLFRDGNWREANILSYSIPSSGDVWLEAARSAETARKMNCDPFIRTWDPKEEKDHFLAKFRSDLIETIQSSWVLSTHEGVWRPAYGDKFVDESSAQDAFDVYCEAVKSLGAKLITQEAGDNYAFALFRIERAFIAEDRYNPVLDQYVVYNYCVLDDPLIIQNGDNIYIVNGIYESTSINGEVLKQLGFELPTL